MWYYTLDGQQAGPISQEELAEKLQNGLPSTTLVWKEGMKEWQPALDTEAFRELTNSLPPAIPATGNQSPYATTSNSSPVAVLSEPYPFPKVKKASYALLLTSTALALTSLIVLVVYFMSNSFTSLQELEAQTTGNLEQAIQAQMDPSASQQERLPELPEVDPMQQLTQIFTPTFFLLSALTTGLFIYSSVLGLMYLYRAWKILPQATASTTPGMAVGFLFIPLFNLYWTFIAYWKWAQDWNATKQRYQCLENAPSPNENLFLSMAICQCASLVISFAGLGQIVLYFIGMKSMCDVINYAAEHGTEEP